MIGLASRSRPRPATRRWAVASAVLAVGLFPLMALVPEPPATKASPARLIVWVIDTDPRGVAVALRDLLEAPHLSLRAKQGGGPADDLAKAGDTDVFQILTDLMRDSRGTRPARPFRLSWGGTDPETPDWTLDVKFADPDTLDRVWTPLWDWRARKNGRRDATNWGRAWRWMTPLRNDLAAGESSAGPPVVILGPQTSDDVIALWLLFKDLPAGQQPWIVSPSATSDLLRPDSLPASADAATADGREWLDELSRMRGYSAREWRFATGAHQEEVQKIYRGLRGVSRTFLQFSQSDGRTIQELASEVSGVLGCRKIAILYPDGPTRDGEPTEPGRPSRNIFGGTLRKNFEDEARRRGFLLYPARLPSPPSLPAATAGASQDAVMKAEDEAKKAEDAWRVATAKALQPTLSFLDRSGVEAVGVFGRERTDILPMVHQRLPWCYLFTTDADWLLESPTPPPRPHQVETTPEAAPSDKKPPAEYPLEGLLVASSPEPPREWLREQMAQLSPVSPEGDAFLPDVEIYYAAHIVKRLVEMLQGGHVDRLRPGTDGQQASSSRRLSHDLHATTHLGNREVLAAERDDFHDGWEAHRPEILRIKDGRLEPMSDARLAGKTIVGAVLGLAIAVGLVRIRAPGSRPSADAVLPRDPSARKGWIEAMAMPLALVCAAVATIGILVLLCLDRGLFSAPVSFSLVPDGHSVLPSVALLAAAATTCAIMPIRFGAELSRLALASPAGSPPAEDRGLGLGRWWRPLPSGRERSLALRVRGWRDRRVAGHLVTSPRERVSSLLLAFALASADAFAGYPLAGANSGPWRIGFGLAALCVGEMVVLYIVITTGWTFVEMMKAATCLLPDLARPTTDPDKEGDPILPREIDPEGLRRLGNLFIQMVAFGLVVFGLILVARLKGVGMARWRWEFAVRPIGLVVPIGLILFGLGLVLILSYWAFCYQTFVSLIREVKSDRIREVDEMRLAKLAEWDRVAREQAEAVSRDETPPDDPFDLAAMTRAFDDEKQQVHAISEQPWEADDARPAWRALAVVVVPPLISALLGGWGGAWGEPIKKGLATLFGGG